MKIIKALLYIVLITIIVVGGYLATKKTETVQKEEQVVSTSENKPTFEWSYSFSSRSDVPLTTVHLTARYADGATTTKKIETIEGTCNEYKERDQDVYPQSQMIICYYAGFGRYYKVVQEGNVYAVKRREFEEASPDYNPPVAPFITLATMSQEAGQAVQEKIVLADQSEGKILKDFFISPELDEELLVPFFGKRTATDYPSLLYFDKDIFVVRYYPAAGKTCAYVDFYSRKTKTLNYSTKGECYMLFKDESHLVFVGSDQIRLWNFGEQAPSIISESILKEGETYSSGYGCMGQCLSIELKGDVITANVYKKEGTPERNELLREVNFPLKKS